MEKQYTYDELVFLLRQADGCLENITYLTNQEIIAICVSRKQVLNKLKTIQANLTEMLAGECDVY